MSDKIGSLIIDLETKELSAEDREILSHPLVGGVIFFARHFESRDQLEALINAIRKSRKTPLLLMVDQEGGRVQRFKNTFTQLPCMGFFGEMYEKNPQVAEILAKEYGWLMAKELLDVGIDLSLAPVLDLNKKLNAVIGDRAFHADPDIVVKLAKATIAGMREAGMAATGKHFPGHGHVSADSHVAMPIDHRTLPEILADDMVPFAKLIADQLPAVMAAHIIFPQVDQQAVGYSNIWLKQILRDQLNFKGAIFSDDLNMEGANISAHYEDRVREAKAAGCDFTLLCNNRKAVTQVLDRLSYANFTVQKEKWGVLQGQFSRNQLALQDDRKWQTIKEKLLRLTQKNESLTK